jgi:hypothetical protein
MHMDSLYDIGNETDLVYRDVIEPFLKRVKRGEKVDKLAKTDISSYFANHIKFDDVPNRINLVIIITDKKLSAYTRPDDLDKIKLLVVMNVPRSLVNKFNTVGLKLNLLPVFIHEIVHVLDIFRSGGAGICSTSKYIEAFNVYGYLSDASEMNSFMHEIKRFKKVYKRYDEIDSITTFENAIMLNGALSGISSLLGLLKSQDAEKYEIVKKKYLKRLFRANLIPKAAKAKVLFP